MSALRPCPFCGSKTVAVEEEEHGRWWDGTWLHVKCHGCCARTISRQTASEAITVWNRRPQPSEEGVSLGVLAVELREALRTVTGTHTPAQWTAALQVLAKADAAGPSLIAREGRTAEMERADVVADLRSKADESDKQSDAVVGILGVRFASNGGLFRSLADRYERGDHVGAREGRTDGEKEPGRG